MSSKLSIKDIVHGIIDLRTHGTQVTLLAVCPNSDAVLEAAVQVAAANHTPMLFAATLNQVDRDGGYTGWTPQAFVARMEGLAEKHQCSSPLYPCLDHGGPWLKDAHTRDGLSLEETMAEVKATLVACLEAGYDLLHVDPTVDRTLPPGQPPRIEVVVERTVELIAYAEAQRERLGLPSVSYEVGTEEVHGGLVDFRNFDRFLTGLRARLETMGLEQAWPCFVVGKVGTDLHTTTFDPKSARRLYRRVAPLGSLIKGHYTDWVANPADYPTTGMGGANVGPEFTATELAALHELCDREAKLLDEGPNSIPSGFKEALRTAVVDSNRWRKWLTAEEEGHCFSGLTAERQEWLVATGARYVWTDPRVLAARRRLYENLSAELSDPNAFVVGRIAQNVEKYVDAFNLRNSFSLIQLACRGALS
jgi:tagatose-1,6-bisphosphate aldolase non-catalytic subunit AgaZ/GatZ